MGQEEPPGAPIVGKAFVLKRRWCLCSWKAPEQEKKLRVDLERNKRKLEGDLKFPPRSPSWIWRALGSSWMSGPKKCPDTAVLRFPAKPGCLVLTRPAFPFTGKILSTVNCKAKWKMSRLLGLQFQKKIKELQVGGALGLCFHARPHMVSWRVCCALSEQGAGPWASSVQAGSNEQFFHNLNKTRN